VIANSEMFIAFWPRYVIGEPRISSWSLAKAIKLPVIVSEPNITSNAIAPMRARPSSPPAIRMSYLARPTSVAASAPKAWERAIRCGIAVIGMKIAIAAPTPEPTTTPIRIHS
jgi:hypothetical protein